MNDFSLGTAALDIRPLLNQHRSIQRGDAGPSTGRGWCLQTLRGRLVEISSAGTTPSLSAAAALLYEAQRRAEPAAWVTAWDATFFPPDLADSGIDLEALPVIRATAIQAGARAADELLRSGAFGLVVLDLGARANVPMPMQARFSGLVKKHQATLLFLTRKPCDAGSLGSLISLRCDGVVWRSSFNRFAWELHVLKDKCRGPGWRYAEVCHGPDGLC
ncbi:MAG: recombinase A [Candidatus Latescibacterota bacterium]|nr:MAG: recombinase A [Candidatus Latescibacterota bacterium]